MRYETLGDTFDKLMRQEAQAKTGQAWQFGHAAGAVRDGADQVTLVLPSTDDEDRVVEFLEELGWETEVDTDHKGQMVTLVDDDGEGVFQIFFPVPETIIVSRHPAQVEYLRGLGFEGVALQHVTASDVTGKIVIGNLPMNLACLCVCVGCADMKIPADKRGCELTLAEVKEYSNGVVWYTVKKEDD